MPSHHNGPVNFDVRPQSTTLDVLTQNTSFSEAMKRFSMPNIDIATANTSGEVSNEEMATYLSSQITGSTFEPIPYQPGMKAGFDIAGVLATISTTADLYTLADALLSAYRLHIWPHRDKNPSSALAVRMHGPDGKSNHLMIGDSTSREVVVENLRVTITTITADKIHIKR